VIRHASRELSRLEAAGVATPQLDLFGAPTDPVDASDIPQIDSEVSDERRAEIEAAMKLRDTLREIDPDSLTPREALDLLYALQEGTKS
jgi:hypothetical protein